MPCVKRSSRARAVSAAGTPHAPASMMAAAKLSSAVRRFMGADYTACFERCMNRLADGAAMILLVLHVQTAGPMNGIRHRMLSIQCRFGQPLHNQPF